MKSRLPKTVTHKWYYQAIEIYPDGTRENIQSVIYSKTLSGAVRTIKSAARICGDKILDMKISINPIKEGFKCQEKTGQ